MSRTGASSPSIETYESIAASDGVSKHRVMQLVELAFLSPEIVGEVLDGRQPPGLTTDLLVKRGFPVDWTEQRRLVDSLSAGPSANSHRNTCEQRLGANCGLTCLSLASLLKGDFRKAPERPQEFPPVSMVPVQRECLAAGVGFEPTNIRYEPDERLWRDLPPVRPAHLPGRSRGLHDRSLLVGREPPLAKPLQRHLDEPWLQNHSGGIAIAIKLSPHPQRLQRRVHASRSNHVKHDPQRLVLVGAEAPRTRLLNRRHRRPARGAVAVQSGLGDMQQEGFRGGDPPFVAILADGHTLSEHCLVRRLVVTPARPAPRVTALTLSEPRREWRLAMPDLVRP